jgi:hypothetical protein
MSRVIISAKQSRAGDSNNTSILISEQKFASCDTGGTEHSNSPFFKDRRCVLGITVTGLAGLSASNGLSTPARNVVLFPARAVGQVSD